MNLSQPAFHSVRFIGLRWILCLIMFALGAFTGPIGYLPAAATPTSDTLTVGTMADVVSLDPANVEDGESLRVTNQLFDTLFFL